jgi:hypothetical protein
LRKKGARLKPFGMRRKRLPQSLGTFPTKTPGLKSNAKPGRYWIRWPHKPHQPNPEKARHRAGFFVGLLFKKLSHIIALTAGKPSPFNYGELNNGYF